MTETVIFSLFSRILQSASNPITIFQGKYSFNQLNFDSSHFLLVLLTVFWYAEYRFVLVEKTKSAKNIWEPVIVKVIILGFLVADTS